MEFKADLSKPGRSRLLYGLGKRTRGGETNESEIGDSARDLGSMPFAQTKMGVCETPQRAAKKFQRRTRASSALGAFASDYPFETAELMRRGAAAFSYRVRRFALFRCSAFRVGTFTFAAFGSAYEPRTRTCATCL